MASQRYRSLEDSSNLTQMQRQCGHRETLCTLQACFPNCRHLQSVLCMAQHLNQLPAVILYQTLLSSILFWKDAPPSEISDTSPRSALQRYVIQVTTFSRELLIQGRSVAGMKVRLHWSSLGQLSMAIRAQSFCVLARLSLTNITYFFTTLLSPPFPQADPIAYLVTFCNLGFHHRLALGHKTWLVDSLQLYSLHLPQIDGSEPSRSK